MNLAKQAAFQQHTWQVEQRLKNIGDQQSSYLFTEDDNSDPSDYDYVRLNLQEGQFTIHLDNYTYFELLHEDISDGSGRLQFATYYSDTPSEDPAFVSPGISGYDWKNADMTKRRQRNIYLYYPVF